MIQVFGSSTSNLELEYVSEVLNSNWLGKGKYTYLFEQKMKEHLKTDNFLMVNSGTNALYLAFKALDLGKNAEVIIPSFTWLACANAIIMAGYKPIFCDVDVETGNISIETIKNKITPQTKAILVVHYAGKPVNITPILNLGYTVIEDAAHAVDSSIDGQKCGTFGDIGIYSFDAIKNIAAGEGGGMTFKDPSLYQKAFALRYSGIGQSSFDTFQSNEKWWEYNIQEPSLKFLSNDICSAIALAQLERLEELQNKRKKIWEKYQEAFTSLDWIKTPPNPEVNEKHSYFTYFIQIENRDKLAIYLKTKGIYTTLRYHPLHLNSIYKSQSIQLPNSECLNKTGLNLPLHPNLKDDEVNYIITSILEKENWNF